MKYLLNYKVSVSLVLIILGFKIAYAQDSTKLVYPKFEIGIDGGLNFTYFANGPYFGFEPFKPSLGFKCGINFQYNFGNVFSLKSGISFDRKAIENANGWKFHTGSNNGKNSGIANGIITTDYLIIPILARVSLGNRVRFFINAGVYFGYLLKKVYHLTMIDDGSKQNDEEINYRGRFDFGVLAGMGISVPIKAFSISLEIRDDFGLRFLYNHEAYYRLNSIDLIIGLNYRFN